MPLFRRASSVPPVLPVEEGFSPVGLYVGPNRTAEISWDESVSQGPMVYQFAEMDIEPIDVDGGRLFSIRHGMPGGLAQARAIARDLLARGYVRSTYPTRSAYDHARWLEQNPAADFTPERGRAAYEALLSARAADPESPGYEERLHKIMFDTTSPEDSAAVFPGATGNVPGRR